MNATDGTTSLHVKADLNNLAVIREFVGGQLAGFGVAEDTTHSIILAVDELCANIMLHGYRGQSGIIDIQIAVEGSSVSIQLLDRAPLFDPDTAPEPDISLPPEDRALGGMGIFLARQIMDQMSHEPRPGGGNQITLIKHVL